MDYKEQLAACQDLIDDALEFQFLDDTAPYNQLLDAMRYSLLAGGKRLRPVLVMEFFHLCGGQEDRALPAALGVEMLHTYSLIHDDLPSMDNDDLRRGKPTNHKIYGEATATLAGDALQAAAFETVLSAPIGDSARLRCASILAEAAGPKGICGGQQLDLEWEGRSLNKEELEEIHIRKTAALIRAACLMGAAAGGASDEQMACAGSYANHVGLAFQIRDDILDVISTTETLGKPVGSDAENQKTTYAALFGIEHCEKLIEQETRLAKEALTSCTWPDDPGFLCWLADRMAGRSK